MTPERWKQISHVYAEARTRPSDERRAFLLDACGSDDALRCEVEALLDQPTSPAVLEGLTPSAMEVLGSDVPALTGRRFGAYIVGARIDSGGMGDVYRARDTQLGRDVAIKVVQPAFARDPDRLARFEREAQVLAALDHPHIGTIYGIEESEGVRALVLALIEGDTLADRIARGPLPITEALEYAGQIADALEAAHEKGIIHRDLKPANIKITPNGVVKVLDFGLAKTMGSSASETLTATQPANATRTGVLLGTPAYMSPEQARGHVVDERADIWAFGCVEYEMLTGREAFGGQTASDTLAAILEREPDWRVLPASVPASITRMLQRCLDKDPKRRLHDIADARIEIEDALRGPSPAPSDASPTDHRLQPFHRRWSIAVIAALGVLVALLGFAWNLRTRSHAETSPRVSRTTITSPRATVDANSSLAMTPDGTRLVYTGNEHTQLFVRRLDQLEPIAIYTAAAPLNWVFLSPDGLWIGFIEGGRVKKVAITGGPVTSVAQAGTGPLGATWLPDDTVVFAGASDRTRGLERVSTRSGVVTLLTQPDSARGEDDHAWPEALPGGRAILYTITATTGGLDAAQIAVLDLAKGTSTVLVRGGSHARYVSSGHLVYAVGRTLVAVPFDLDRLQVRGTPVQVLQRLATKAEGGVLLSASADGTLVYLDVPAAGGPLQYTMVWVDCHGGEEPLGAPVALNALPRLSPDGKRVAVRIGNDIFIWDLDRHQRTQLTVDPGEDLYHTWMPDSRYLVFYSNRARPAIYRQPADGTTAAQAISDGMGGMAMLPSSVTPDGSRVLFSLGGRDLMALNLDETRRVERLIVTPANERNGIVSPNGRWLVYESDRSGSFEVYVRPYPNVTTGSEWKISTAGGMKPLWARNGRELFYVAPDGALMGVTVDAGDAVWSAGSPTRIVDGPYMTRGALSGRTYDVSPDGERFLMLKLPPFDPATTPQIQTVQHWFEELRRLAPVN